MNGWMIALIIWSNLAMIIPAALHPSPLRITGQHYFTGPRAVCIHCNVSMFDLRHRLPMEPCDPPKKYPGAMF